MIKRAKVVAIDFDETIGLYNPKIKSKGYIPKKFNNVPNPRIVKLIKKFRRNGIKVIIYSSRWWPDYNNLVDWLKKHKIVVDDIILGRFKADLYICDKAINAHLDDLELQAKQLLNKAHSWGCYYNKYYPKLRK